MPGRSYDGWPLPWSWRCSCTGWCPMRGWHPCSVRTQAHRSPWPLWCVLGRLRGATPRQRVDGQRYELWGRPRAHDLRCSGQFLFRGGGRRPCARPRLHLYVLLAMSGACLAGYIAYWHDALAALELTRESRSGVWAFGQSSETWDNSLSPNPPKAGVG